jgi:uncharacterized Tic20 family protein
MVSRIVLAVVVGVVVALVCVLVGGLLATLEVSFAVTVGNFLKSYAGVLGLLAALWYAFSGGFGWPNRKV